MPPYPCSSGRRRPCPCARWWRRSTTSWRPSPRRASDSRQCTSDWRRLVESDEIDVVDISTPNNTHREIAVAALDAGKHVICEKPLAHNVDDAKAMYEAAQRCQGVHMVAFNYRRTPAVALARKLIEEGAIGAVRNFRGTYLQDWSADPNSPLSWRFQKEVAGSGALGDIGTHVLDMARYLVGEVVARVVGPARPTSPSAPSSRWRRPARRCREEGRSPDRSRSTWTTRS